MKLYILSALVLIVTATSCKTEDKSGGGIPPEKMQKIMMDLHLAEAYSSMVNDTLHQSREKNMDSLAVYYKQVFAHHDITREQFDASIDWYKQHPSELDSVYKKMITGFSIVEGVQQVK